MKKILIIKDDANSALALVIRLKAHGFATAIASDAISGLSMAIRQHPDLVLLDIAIPGGDGFALAEKLQTHPETKDPPVIFLTASKDPELRQKVMDLGAAGLLEKPYQTEDLLLMINYAFERPGRARRAHLLALPAGSPSPGGLEALGKRRKEFTEGESPWAERAGASESLGRGEASASSPSPGGEGRGEGGLSASAIPEDHRASHKKILLVEDDTNLAKSLRIRLEAAGYHALIAEDGLAAVNAAVKNRPDLVLLDISMPAGSGFTVAQRIQTAIPTPTPIIFLTASKRPEFRKKAEELGAVGFFEKPFEADELLATIKQALARAPKELPGPRSAARGI